MEVLGWVVWGLVLVAVVALLFSFRTIYQSNQMAIVCTALAVLMWVVALVGLYLYPYSKLHLLWFFPASFIVSVFLCKIPGLGMLFEGIALLFLSIVRVGAEKDTD